MANPNRTVAKFRAKAGRDPKAVEGANRRLAADPMMEDCPRCKGSGEFAIAGGPLAACGFCGGTGHWRITFQDDRASEMAAVSIAGWLLALVPILVLIAAISKFG